MTDVIRRLAAANPVPHDGPLHLPARVFQVGARRPLVAVVVAVAALAGAGVAVAAGLGAFEGTPAPPDVSTSFSHFNQVIADSATQQSFASVVPQADVSKAHGVIEVQTADGPEDLWAAPNNQGGQCYFIDWANDVPSENGNRNGFGGCDPVPPPASNINWGAGSVAGHPDLVTAFGTVFVDATNVELTLGDGSTVTLPVVEHLFLTSLSKGTDVTKVVALDAAGNEVAEST